MGSIEIYDHKNKRWVPYVPDYKKWEQHFTDVLEGRVRADHRGQYLVGSGASGDSTLTKSNQTLPKSVAQTLEMAKSRNWLDRKLEEERNAEVLSTNWTNHEPLGRTVGIHASAHQYRCQHQTMDRIPTHQPNKRGNPCWSS